MTKVILYLIPEDKHAITEVARLNNQHAYSLLLIGLLSVYGHKASWATPVTVRVDGDGSYIFTYQPAHNLEKAY